MYIIAHRIRGFDEPDNSLAALKKAIRSPIHGIEIDVRRTKDGKLVAWHDRRYKKNTLRKITQKEAQKLGLMSYEQSIELFAKRKYKQQFLHVDIKDEGCEEVVLEQLQKYKIEKNVIIVSRSERILKRMCALAPHIPRSYIFLPKFNGPFGMQVQPIPIWPLLPRILKQQRAKITYVSVLPTIGWISKWVVKRLNKLNIRTMVVDEDSVRGNIRLEELGIDSTITNNGPELYKFFEKLKKKELKK